jgi:chromosome partition protein MukE
MIFYDTKFVEVDLVLRRGGHVNRSSLTAYDWMCQNFDELQAFYERYGCSLLQHPDGFFFMTLKGGMIRSRLLPKSCVHLGQVIALKARDPEITRSSGWLTINQLMQDIETSIPKETLQKVFARSRKESVVDEKISEEIQRAIKILAELDFVEIKGNAMRPLEAIHRFAELARHNNEPDDMTKLHLAVERGVVFHDASDDEAYGEDHDES